MTRLNINSIYKATEGEGVFLGIPQIFVRFQGCNIGCVNCDSLDTWSFENKNSYTVCEVMMKINEELKGFSQRRVSITGGDPLHPTHTDGVLELVKALKNKGFYVNIEASGSRIDNNIFDLVDFISMDYKSPSTGVKTKISLLKKLNEKFPGKFQVKTVIQNKNDFDDVYNAYHELLSQVETVNFSWCLTPSFLDEDNEIFLERFKNIIRMNMENHSLFRVVGQQHKWIYGSLVKNV